MYKYEEVNDKDKLDQCATSNQMSHPEAMEENVNSGEANEKKIKKKKKKHKSYRNKFHLLGSHIHGSPSTSSSSSSLSVDGERVPPYYQGKDPATKTQQPTTVKMETTHGSKTTSNCGIDVYAQKRNFTPNISMSLKGSRHPPLFHYEEAEQPICRLHKSKSCEFLGSSKPTGMSN